MTSKNEELSKTNLTLEGTIKSNLNEIKNLKREIEVLQFDLNNSKADGDNLLAIRLNETQEVFKKKIEEEKIELKDEIIRLKEEINELNSLKQENIGLKQKIEDYDNDLQQNSATNSNKIYDYQLNALKNENGTLQKEVEELKMKLDDLSDENTSLKINLNELNSMKDLNERIKILNKQLEVRTWIF